MTIHNATNATISIGGHDGVEMDVVDFHWPIAVDPGSPEGDRTVVAIVGSNLPSDRQRAMIMHLELEGCEVVIVNRMTTQITGTFTCSDEDSAKLEQLWCELQGRAPRMSAPTPRAPWERHCLNREPSQDRIRDRWGRLK